MAFRKYTADRIFDGYRFQDGKMVIVAADTGRIEGIVDDTGPADDEVIRLPGILMPGMINCHCHLELSYLKNRIPRNSGMVPFLLSVMRNREEDREVIDAAMVEAASAMTEAGIVAVGDICNTDHSLSVKRQSTLRWCNFIEIAGFNEAQAEERMNTGIKLLDRFSKEFSRSAIVPHAPYSVSDRLLQLIGGYPQSAPLSMHNQESDEERELFLTGKGGMTELYRQLQIEISAIPVRSRGSLLHSLDQLGLPEPLILVHNVYTSEEDLNGLPGEAMKKIFWCLCPGANLYIGSRLPDVALFRRHQAQLVVGTDSLASNEQLSIIKELGILAKHFPGIPLEEFLSWATLNGARALKMDDELGSIETGKRPGLVQLLLDGENLKTAVVRRIL